MDLPKRKSPRLQKYDYAKDNYYFVTICTDGKKCLFGQPAELNWVGKTVQGEIEKIPLYHSSVQVDKYVVMPNHVHLILILGCDESNRNSVKLDTVIGLLKSGVTRKIHEKMPQIKVWQRSFHDHIIRNQQAYEKIWLYIESNPQIWSRDCFYED